MSGTADDTVGAAIAAAQGLPPDDDGGGRQLIDGSGGSRTHDTPAADLGRARRLAAGIGGEFSTPEQEEFKRSSTQRSASVHLAKMFDDQLDELTARNVETESKVRRLQRSIVTLESMRGDIKTMLENTEDDANERMLMRTEIIKLGEQTNELARISSPSRAICAGSCGRCGAFSRRRTCSRA
jgi:chromosome segregation ATPase